jgi:hypothetical protein
MQQMPALYGVVPDSQRIGIHGVRNLADEGPRRVPGVYRFEPPHDWARGKSKKIKHFIWGAPVDHSMTYRIEEFMSMIVAARGPPFGLTPR